MSVCYYTVGVIEIYHNKQADVKFLFKLKELC